MLFCLPLYTLSQYISHHLENRRSTFQQRPSSIVSTILLFVTVGLRLTIQIIPTAKKNLQHYYPEKFCWLCLVDRRQFKRSRFVLTDRSCSTKFMNEQHHHGIIRAVNRYSYHCEEIAKAIHQGGWFWKLLTESIRQVVSWICGEDEDLFTAFRQLNCQAAAGYCKKNDRLSMQQRTMNKDLGFRNGTCMLFFLRHLSLQQKSIAKKFAQRCLPRLVPRALLLLLSPFFLPSQQRRNASNPDHHTPADPEARVDRRVDDPQLQRCIWWIQLQLQNSEENVFLLDSDCHLQNCLF